MAQIPGSVRVGGFVAPTDSTDTFAVTDEFYNRGGYRSVADLAARDAITPDRRKVGMLVRVTTDGKIYYLNGGLTNADWVELQMGAGGLQAVTTAERLAMTPGAWTTVLDTDLALMFTWTGSFWKEV